MDDGHTAIAAGFFHGFALKGVVLNSPPTANAGADQSIRAGDTVDLDGSASFDDNTASALLDQFRVAGPLSDCP